MNFSRSQLVFVLVYVLLIFNSCFPMQYSHSKVIINGVVMNGGGQEITPSVHIDSESYSIEDIDKVKLKDGTLLVYQHDNQDSLEVTANRNILPYIALHATKRILTLGLKNNIRLSEIAHIVYTLRTKNLNSIKLSGCGDVKFMEPFESPSLTVEISGSGRCYADSLVTKILRLKLSGSGSFNFNKLRCENLQTSISGSGSASFRQGSAGDQEFRISGSGNIQAAQLHGKVANVEISGKGNAEVNIDDTLTVRAPSPQCVTNSGRATPIFEKNSSSNSVVIMNGSSIVAAASVYVNGTKYW